MLLLEWALATVRRSTKSVRRGLGGLGGGLGGGAMAFLTVNATTLYRVAATRPGGVSAQLPILATAKACSPAALLPTSALSAFSGGCAAASALYRAAPPSLCTRAKSALIASCAWKTKTLLGG